MREKEKGAYTRYRKEQGCSERGAPRGARWEEEEEGNTATRPPSSSSSSSRSRILLHHLRRLPHSFFRLFSFTSSPPSSLFPYLPAPMSRDDAAMGPDARGPLSHSAFPASRARRTRLFLPIPRPPASFSAIAIR